MNQFKKLAKAFTTWKSSSSVSSDNEKKHDDYTDAMAYIKKRAAQEEYNRHLRGHPLMNQSTANAAGQAAMWNSAMTTGIGMGAVNQAWTPTAPMEHKEYFMHDVSTFTVERVANGFIIRSGKYSKVCSNMDELKDLFVSIMVEAQLDK